MPAKFERCRAAGGRIRTIKPRGRCDPLYIPICRLGKGKSVAGEPRYASRLPEDCRQRKGRRRQHR